MSSINKKNKMNKNNDNKIKLTFHPAEFGAKMPIPLAEQSVKAGFPSPAQDYMEGEIDLNDILVRHREATFYVRISGDSMQDAGILDGDLAVVDRQIEPSNGNFVIAFVDGEFPIKQFKIDESGTFGAKRKSILDSVSATVILDDYLAWRKEHPGEV